MANKSLAYTAFTLLILLFLFISSFTPVITRGEGREGLIIKSLAYGESLILPLRHGEEIPSKPPLFHWVGYGVSEISGNLGPMEIRAGSALGSALLIVGTYLFFSIFSGPLLGLLTALMLASTLEVMRYSTQARVDPLFAGTFSSAVFFIFSFYVGKGSRILTGFGSILFLVLSVLAKGPFGLILPAAVLVIYLLQRLEWPDFRVLSKGVFILIVAGALSSIWYVLAYKIGGDRFLEVQLLKENAYRVIKAEGDERGHEKPFYFTFIYLFLAVIPWCLFLPRIIAGLQVLKKEGELRSNQVLMLCISWGSLFVMAVLVSVSKRSVYFLPALPALSYLFALCMLKSQGLVLNKWIVKYENVLGFVLKSVLLLSGFVILQVLYLPYFLPYLQKLAHNKSFLQFYFFSSALDDSSCLVYLVALMIAYKYISSAFEKFEFGRVEDAIAQFSLSFMLLFFTTQVLIGSRVMGMESPERFIHEAEELLPPSEISKNACDHLVMQYKNEFYAPAFYINRPLPVVASIEALDTCAESSDHKERYIFVAEKDLADFKNRPHKILLISAERLANREQKLILIQYAK